MFQYPRIGSTLVAALFLVPLLAFPAHADRVTEALTQASKMLEKGIPVKAIEIINNALKGDKIPSEIAAKALLMRAQAHEKLGKQAYALADYNSALWMQGLSDRDKKDAEAGRDRILGKLGVKEPATAEEHKAVVAAAPEPPAAPPAQPRPRAGAERSNVAASGTQVQTTPSEQRTNGVGGFFNSLFGSSEAAPADETRPRQKPPVERVRPQPAKIEQKPIAALVETQSPRETGSVTHDANGNFAIQFAALVSEDSAIHEVNRIGKRYGEWLDGRTPSVTILGTKDGGTLYKVIAEPYQRGQATATCELLKTKGVNCMIISRQ